MSGAGVSGEVCHILLRLLGHPLPRMCATSAGKEGLEALHSTGYMSMLFRNFSFKEVNEYVTR